MVPDLWNLTACPKPQRVIMSLTLIILAKTVGTHHNQLPLQCAQVLFKGLDNECTRSIYIA